MGPALGRRVGAPMCWPTASSEWGRGRAGWWWVGARPAPVVLRVQERPRGSGGLEAQLWTSRLGT